MFVCTFASAQGYNFQVEKRSSGNFVWEYTSPETKPLLYIITAHAGHQYPFDCKSGHIVFWTRGSLVSHSDSIPGSRIRGNVTFQFCAMDFNDNIKKKIVLYR